MRILITGGSGFIGTHLIKKLSSDGHDIYNLDKISSPALPSDKQKIIDILDIDTKIKTMFELEKKKLPEYKDKLKELKSISIDSLQVRIKNNIFKSIKDLENLALAYQGVEKAYAIQAGRELRVIVEADKVTDDASEKLSFEIAQKIQTEMTFPGQIKVTVIREKRAVNIAR